MGLNRPLDVRLRAVRTQARLSQAELAVKAGVTRQAISAVESGKAIPTTPVALCIARVLGRRVEDLFRLVDDRPRVIADLLGAPNAWKSQLTVRVQVASIGGRVVAHPLLPDDTAAPRELPANGMVCQTLSPPDRRQSGRHRSVAALTGVAELFVEPESLTQTLL